MNIHKFKQVNEALAARFGLQTIVIVVLALVVLFQQFYIQSREEVIIERPAFQDHRTMTMVRNQATQDVREVWAFNLVMLMGNVNPSNHDWVRATAYSTLLPHIREQMLTAHKELLQTMTSRSLDVRFEPDGRIEYDRSSGFVTIRGHRVVENLATEEENIRRVPYKFRVLIEVDGFSPYVVRWEEGEI